MRKYFEKILWDEWEQKHKISKLIGINQDRKMEHCSIWTVLPTTEINLAIQN